MDIFAQIAQSGIHGRRDQLCRQEPLPLPDHSTTLAGGDAVPMSLPEKLADAASLRQALAKARAEYAPFLRRLAPPLVSCRNRQTLKNFRWKEAPDAPWQEITIPHYGGPLGRAVTVYETTFRHTPARSGEAVFVTVNGADYKAHLYLNGSYIGSHEGFFASFSFEITALLRPDDNTLTIELENDYIMLGSSTENDPQKFCGDKLYAATGPGYDDPEIGWHHCPPGTGLLDTVEIETRPVTFIDNVFTRTLPETDEMEFWVEVNHTLREPREISFVLSIYGANLEGSVLTDYAVNPSTGKELGLGDTFTEINARRDGTLNATLSLPCGRGTGLYKLRVPANGLKWWTPEAPYLYQLQLQLLDKEGSLLDTFCQDFGRRTFTQDTDAEPKGMFRLNGTPIRLRGANTMGFEQQDVMRGDEAQLIDDILLARLCNMNFLRITQRPVQQKIYDYCDRLGLMLQTDLPLFGCLRRRQFCEAVRQAEEMERHIRRHPCCILVSYINEPFPNAYNLPNMNLERKELEQFFAAATIVVKLNNPDRVIKQVDGDYDPPSTSLPDNHCYCMWYNGHGIDIGRLHKGYWLPVRPGWYYGCGEFGCEGLEDWELMQKAYPAAWLPQPGEPLSDWTPDRIVGEQTGNFYHFFFDRQDTPQAWVAASQAYQALATRMMTEAFRRNDRMVTFALHLFIDAFPAGWMKTIMDCRRTPKPAYFAYRNALEPLMLSLRTDKTQGFSGENACAEVWLCNDTARDGDYTLRYELVCGGRACAQGETTARLAPNHAFCCDIARFELPCVTTRTDVVLRSGLFEGETCLAWNALHYTVYPACPKACSIMVKPLDKLMESDLTDVQNGAVLLLESGAPGTYRCAGETVTVQESGMAPLHYASAKTGHRWVQGFQPEDFRHWYCAEEDCISPLAECTLSAAGFATVLGSRNLDPNGNWQPAALLCEKTIGAGRLILSSIPYCLLQENPAGRILLSRMES